jgi:hypothetical protein
VYLEYTSLRTIRGNTSSLLNVLKNHGEVDKEGKPIYRLYYNVEPRENRRYFTNNYNVIGISEQLQPALTVPEGYFMVWADLKQSDLRWAMNMLIRDERNAQTMDTYEDTYEGIYRIICDFHGEEFDHDFFLELRSLMKTDALSTINGGRTGKSPLSRNFVQKFNEYLKTCKKYQDFSALIDLKTELGIPVSVSSYFGYTQSIVAKKSYYGAEENKALNTPFQTSTSESIILLVDSVLSRFYELGWTSEDVGVYMIRHDEYVLYIKNDMKKDAWILEQCKTFIVDNLQPMGVDLHFGYSYNVEDVKLTQEMSSIFFENLDKIDIVKPDIVGKPFIPTSEVRLLGASFRKTKDGRSVVAIYDPQEDTAKITVVAVQDNEEIGAYILSKLKEAAEILRENHVATVVIFNDFVNSDNHTGKFLAKFIKRNHVSTMIASTLSEHGYRRYCEKSGISFDGDIDLLNTNEELFTRVGSLTWM